MKYRKQRHRYAYQPHTANKGHIKWEGSTTALCGKELVGYERVLVKFDSDKDLCETCVRVLKRYLAEEYRVQGWVQEPMEQGHG